MRVLTLEETAIVGGGCHPNNGWGNGDQAAPGNSLLHNRAENDVTPGAVGPNGLIPVPNAPGADGCPVMG